MRAGIFDRRVTIQRKITTIAPSGAAREGWTTIGSRWPASMWPAKTDERFTAPEKVATEQIEFRIRYGSAVEVLTPQDRIIHPALTAEQEADPDHVIPTRSIHDVLGVSEIGRREGLKVITQRRADVTS